jgi:hypothetical protein
VLVIVHSLIDFGGLLVVNVAKKVVCFGVDSVTILQGLKISVIVQIMNKHNLLLAFFAWHIGITWQCKFFHPCFLLQRLRL